MISIRFATKVESLNTVIRNKDCDENCCCYTIYSPMFQVCILLCYRLVTFKFCLHNLYELIASAMPVVYNNTFGSNIHTKQQYANVAYNKAPNATQFALFTQFHIVLSRTKFVFSKLEVVCQLLSLLSASSTAAFCYVTFLLIPAN